MRKWQTVPPLGRVVGDPVVLALAAGADPGLKPRVVRVDGRVIVTYSRTRLYVDRTAWEALPDTGILLVRVRPTGAAAFSLALTRGELEETFGEVRESRSWDDIRCYHFPVLPPAAEAFRVRIKSAASTDVPSASPSGSPATMSRKVTAHSAGPSAQRTVEAIRALPPNLTKMEWANAIAAICGVPCESAEYLSRGDFWRERCRPGSLTAAIIAESHVAEMPGDLGVHIRPHPLLPQNPAGYVRLIHCPGYGEPSLCSTPPNPNGGTPSFWYMFEQVALALCPDIANAWRSGDRITRKLVILETLKRWGVHLFDASVVGIYVPRGGRRFTGTVYGEIIRQSYCRFVLPELGAGSRRVWVVGYAVAKALRGLPLIGHGRAVPLPGWHPERFRAAVESMAREIAQALRADP